jgi:hypothetical protein
MMKWNDAWLANVDCDGDGLLDRHYGFGSYIGSGAWLTNHMWGSYLHLADEWSLVFVRDDGAEFPHTWSNTSLSDGQFTGDGVSGLHSYTFVGTLDGNNLSFVATYGHTLPGYTYTAEGSVLADGSLSGTWQGSNGRYGTWYSTTGALSNCEWDYFTKIVAAPADATTSGGVWYAADGTEIGPVIWSQFATIQTVENDPCAGIEGIQYISPDHPGFGGW